MNMPSIEMMLMIDDDDDDDDDDESAHRRLKHCCSHKLLFSPYISVIISVYTGVPADNRSDQS